ncbi:MAG TPA: MBL fold metallo-hydrolase [Actinomycetota bacterium]|nr:MBL fold metallo-hydrolase [Actinomycetota bacterium]
MARALDAIPGVHTIDTRMCGRDRVTSAYLVAAERPALVETGPTTSGEALRRGLRDLGIGPADLAHIVVTHIHLDHAGGAGALAPHFPDATVWVHERGAPHLADPTKLVGSAERVYGAERLRELFGPVQPVPRERLRAVADGDRIDLGDRQLEVVYTPGHASHHVCLVDSASGGAFVGDAVGVFLPDVGILRPASPPPEFDLELALSSIERIAERRPPVLLFSHFGPHAEVSHLCALAIQRLRKWARIVEQTMESTEDLDEVVRMLRAATASEVAPATGDRRALLEDRYELLSSYEMNAMGLMRYVTKRRDAVAEAGGGQARPRGVS